REKVTTEIRQRGDPCRRDDLGGSGAVWVELGISRGVDRHRRQLDGGRQERELGDEALVEGEQDAGPGLGCEPQGADLDAIGPAYRDVLEEITAARPCSYFPAAAVRQVRHADARPGDRRAVLTRHSPLNRRGRDALRVQQPRQRCERQQQERAPHRAPAKSLWKRGLPRNGSQVGSTRSQAVVRCPGIHSSCSSRSIAASYSPTIV